MNGEPDVDQETLNLLLDTRETIHAGVVGENGELDEDFVEDVRELEDLANAMVRHVLVEGPELTFDVMTPEAWIRGRLPRWRADGWDLPHLSRAERRWVSLAVRVAGKGGPFVLLCDEPEQGLHRLAEHRLATGLPAMMQERGGAAVVATHSPDLLNAPHVDAVFVARDEDGWVRTRRAKPSFVDGQTSRETARQFSLAPGDLLALSRLSVVVEGLHDEWVFKNLLRDELDSASAGILPMHGATRLRALHEARLLLDGTEAKVLVVLDDLDHDVAQKAVQLLRSAVRNEDNEETTRALDNLRELGKANDSFLFIHQLVREAVQLGELERISFFGLSLPDVICYLEPSSVLLEDRRWDDLIKQWTDEAAPKSPKNIKGWLRRKRLLPEDPRMIDEAIEMAAIRAVEENAPVHPDLVALGTTITAMGLTSRDQ